MKNIFSPNILECHSEPVEESFELYCVQVSSVYVIKLYHLILKTNNSKLICNSDCSGNPFYGAI